MPQAGDELIRLMKEEWLGGQRRNARFSLRAFARRIGLPPSAISELFNGKRGMTARMARRVVQGMALPPESGEAILALFAGPPPHAPASRAREFVQLRADQFHVISRWFYYAVLSLAETRDFRPEPRWIARRLGISTADARKALERLTRLGLLPVGAPVTTTTDIPDSWLKSSHFENLDLAVRSLEEDPLLERDFSSMTLVGDPARLPEAKARIRKFRRELTAFLESGDKKEVFQLNVQFFRLTGRKRKPT
jgi:transcriptional regulator with XRE-family HTH domain